jgi:lysophospholipase L1-like esterase
MNFQIRVLDIDPDLIIVYHGVNDIHTRLTWPPERYTSDNASYHAPPSEIMWPSALEHSTFLRALMIRMGRVQPHSNLERSYGAPSPDYHGWKFLIQRQGNSYPQGIFDQTSAEAMFAANPPRFFERNLESLIAVARHWDVGVVLATFAHSPDFPKHPQASSPEYQVAYEEMRQIMISLGEKTDAVCYDFAGAFPPEARYYADGMHMNEEGAALKAKLIADFLIERDLLD